MKFPVLFQTKQNAWGRDSCCTFTQVISVSETEIIVIKFNIRSFRAHFVSFGMKQENLWYFSEALGKASPKICTQQDFGAKALLSVNIVALSAELRRSGLLLKNTIDSPSPPKELQKSILSGMDIIYIRFGKYKYYRKIF